MPLYEYECRGCGHKFEALVRKGDEPACPSCKSQDLQQMLSQFAVSSEGTRQVSLQKARKANEPMLRDKKMAEIEAINHHDD